MKKTHKIIVAISIVCVLVVSFCFTCFADYTFTVINFDAKVDADKLYSQFASQVENNEIRNLQMSLNNAIVLGGRSVGITFHSKK